MGPTPNPKLAAWRARHGFTLEEVADLAGLSKSHLSRLERGERNASPRTKVEIARRLDARVSDLFEVEALEPGDEVIP